MEHGAQAGALAASLSPLDITAARPGPPAPRSLPSQWEGPFALRAAVLELVSAPGAKETLGKPMAAPCSLGPGLLPQNA